MSHVDTSPLSMYNSLSDPHLAGYFANTKMRNHLRRSGLISRRGEIVSENSYRLNMARREHKKHVKDLLAQAIVHKTLDLERHRQVAIRQKLEEIAKIELVQRVKSGRTCNKYNEAVLPLLTPRKEKGKGKRHKSSKTDRPITPSSPEPSDEEYFEEMITYVDDNGNPIDWPESVRGRSRTPRSREEIDARHLYTLNPAAIRRYATTLARMEQTNALVSPYLMPQVPIPPASPRTGPSRMRGHTARSTSSDKSPKRSPGRDLHRQEPPMRHQGDIHSMCQVKMKYHGWALNLARETRDPRQEIIVEQQHCGGNTLTVFRDLLVPGSTFTFTSKRHRGYPFSLTLYVDGRQDCRVSTCCEMGHSKKVRLGGKMGHFSIVSIGGMSPCYKCQVKKGIRGGKAPPRKLKRPAKDETGEEVIVMDTVAKEKPSQTKEEAPKEEDSDSDDYEDDFDDSDEDEKKEEDEVVFDKDWKSSKQGHKDRRQDKVKEDEEDKRQIRGLPDDLCEDSKENKTATVPAEKSSKPSNSEDYEEDKHRKVEGYSDEEEDLEGEKSKTVVVEKTTESSATDTADSSSDSSSSSSSSDDESLTEGELIVQSDTDRSRQPESTRADPAASGATVDETKPQEETSARTDAEQFLATAEADTEQKPGAGAENGSGAGEQATLPTPPNSPPHSPKQDQQPLVPAVVVIPNTPEVQERQGEDSLPPRPKTSRGLPDKFQYQPKHESTSDEGHARHHSESEPETNHGGNDPDNVAENDSVNWRGSMEFIGAPEQRTHSGSITPLLDGCDDIQINNINMTKSQLVELMQAIEMKETIHTLSVSNAGLGLEEVQMLLQSLAKSPAKPMVLNLNYNTLGPASVDALVDIIKIKPTIEMLLLQGNPIGNKGLQTLVDGLLDIEYEAQEYKRRESESQRGVPVILPKGRFCQLKELDIGEASVTDEGMVDIVLLLESNLDLETLSLSSSPDITQPGWNKLGAALAKNRRLKTLTLEHNKISDAGILAITEGLKNNTSLTSLDLADSRIGEEGGRAIVDLLKRNTTILNVTLSPGNSIPDKTVEEIQRYLSLNQASPK